MLLQVSTHLTKLRQGDFEFQEIKLDEYPILELIFNLESEREVEGTEHRTYKQGQPME